MRGVLDAVDGHSLRSGFLASAKQFADRPALVIGGTSWTYAALDDQARRIAAVVVAALGRAPARVGTFASRSRDAYAGTLGALFAGAAFVPLNRKFPTERTAAMVRRARLDAIVVDAGSAPQLRAVLGDAPAPLIVAPDAAAADAVRALGIAVLGPDELRAAEPLRDLPPVLLDDIAYLLFTSGTTGEPKGVGVTHANARHYLDVIAARYALGPDDRCSQTFDQTFDLAVHDLFVTWGAGASLHVLQPIEALAPVRFVNQRELTVWFSVPSAAALAFKKGMLRPDAMPSLRLALFCGEPLPTALAEAWQRSAPSARVENIYGPTELTIACFGYEWRSDTSAAESVNGIVPIGTPFPGLGALVVDDALQPLPTGETGELLVCGPQTTPGYWLDEARTRERFVEITVGDAVTKRFYRTGDRVTRLPSGAYAFMGRTDHQIKVLGFRVELGEIEAALLRGDGVAQAAAIGWPIVDGSAQRIVAFVSGQGVDGAHLRTRAAATLPDYMVPERVVVVDEFPVNANGKIDRRELAARLDQGVYA